MTTPPLPPGIDALAVRRKDGTETYVVSLADAARLCKRSAWQISEWIEQGLVETTKIGTAQYVLVDSLWAALPPEVR